jgi:hypothetical protein
MEKLLTAEQSKRIFAKPWLYIAGPISLGDTNVNAHHGMQAFDIAWRNGFQPICPHWSCLQQMTFPLPYSDWIAYDVPLLLLADAVWRIPGESKGAEGECKLAAENGIPVFTALVDLLEWKEKRE